MNIEHDYDVHVQWNIDRRGTLSSTELPVTIEVATPPQFPKGEAGIWSPEHLFVAAINSCLMTTFLAIAENSKLEFSDFDCKATGKLAMIDGKYLMTEVTLMPVVTIVHEKDKERAERILQKSETACLISNSVKSKIIYTPTVNIAIEA